ncbi:MAG: hypothetical protein ACRCU1_01000 [Alsobacter sp.]
MIPVIAELDRIAATVARGAAENPMASASPEALRALADATSAMERCRRSGRPDREIPIRAAVAIAMLMGVPVATPSRTAARILGPCRHCGADTGKRCRQPNGMPAKTHVGRGCP